MMNMIDPLAQSDVLSASYFSRSLQQESELQPTTLLVELVKRAFSGSIFLDQARFGEMQQWYADSL